MDIKPKMHTSSQEAPIFSWFGFVSSIPRPSGGEKPIIAAISAWAKQRGLVPETDDFGNLLIRKPAHPDAVIADVTALQAHVDMVTVSDHDRFRADRNPIDYDEVDGWLCARGTTLGADNGLGVAAILAVLASENLPHGPIEALFTVEEEIGLNGAKALRPNWLQATRLINLDAEEDCEIVNGAAGGVPASIVCEMSAKTQPIPSTKTHEFFEISIAGLPGGHSGLDIDKGRPNAILELAGCLAALGQIHDIWLLSLQGGTGRNAIPVAAKAVVAVAMSDSLSKESLLAAWPQLDATLARVTNHDNHLTSALPPAATRHLMQALASQPSGVLQRMPTGHTATSLNLGEISYSNGHLEAAVLGRFVLSEGSDLLKKTIADVWGDLDATLDIPVPHAAWSPKSGSPLLEQAVTAYQDLFEQTPDIATVHAGLECATILMQYPDLDTISIGPKIENAHTTSERAEVASIHRFWALLQAILSSSRV